VEQAKSAALLCGTTPHRQPTKQGVPGSRAWPRKHRALLAPPRDVVATASQRPSARHPTGGPWPAFHRHASKSSSLTADRPARPGGLGKHTEQLHRPFSGRRGSVFERQHWRIPRIQSGPLARGSPSAVHESCSTCATDL